MISLDVLEKVEVFKGLTIAALRRGDMLRKLVFQRGEKIFGACDMECLAEQDQLNQVHK